MKASRSVGVAAFALAVGGCSWFRWQGYQARRQSVPEKTDRPAAPLGEMRSKTKVREEISWKIHPAAAPAPPENFTDEELKARYYYDLGPKTIDVSRYPTEQRYNYSVFARACAQCHTLSRPINSPRSSFWAWRYYVYRMRLHGRFTPGVSLTEREAERILNFLTYDSMVRKGENREEFETTTRRLERRFDDALAERARRAGNPASPGK